MNTITAQEKIQILEAKRSGLNKQWQQASEEARYWLEQEIDSLETKIFNLSR